MKVEILYPLDFSVYAHADFLVASFIKVMNVIRHNQQGLIISVGQSPRHSVTMPSKLGRLPVGGGVSKKCFRLTFCKNRNLAGSFFTSRILLKHMLSYKRSKSYY